MRWSKLKQTVEAMFAESVSGRVQLWTTRYAKAHDRFGRSWISIDGREVAIMANYLRCGESVADGNADRFAEGVFAGYDLPLAMREFLGMSIDSAIASPKSRASSRLLTLAGWCWRNFTMRAAPPQTSGKEPPSLASAR